NFGRLQYTGQAWLPELGLYYYRARVYDPELGRFLQTDPIGYADSPNLYAYVLNDPVNLTDPLGLEIWCRGAWATVCGHTLGGWNVQRWNGETGPGPRRPPSDPEGGTGSGCIIRNDCGKNQPVPPKHKPKSRAEQYIPCSEALAEGGAILAVGLGFTFTPGVGATAQF